MKTIALTDEQAHAIHSTLNEEKLDLEGELEDGLDQDTTGRICRRIDTLRDLMQIINPTAEPTPQEPRDPVWLYAIIGISLVVIICCIIGIFGCAA